MSNHTPTTHQPLEDYLLYSSPADVFVAQSATPRTALWACVFSLIAVAGCGQGLEPQRPLHKAAAEGPEDEVRLLLTRGEDP